MSKPRKRRSSKVGLPPGTLVHVGEVKTRHTGLSLFRYDAEHLTEQSADQLAGLDLTPPKAGTFWLNIHGLHDTAMMADIGQAFQLHPLVMEDILNTNQRPKLDSYPDYLFLVTRFFSYDPDSMTIGSDRSASSWAAISFSVFRSARPARSTRFASGCAQTAA
jgi:Mg2+ and Co2+ transporters